MPSPKRRHQLLPPVELDRPATSDRAPDLRALVEAHARRWERAACTDADPELFHPDGLRIDRRDGNAGAPTVLYPLLAYCASCPLRRECLAEAFDLRRPNLIAIEGEIRTGQTTSPAWVQGLWGGTTQWERQQVRDLPANEAVAMLERTFTMRLQRRIQTFREWHDERVATGKHPTKMERRVLEVLEARVAREGVA